MLFFTVSRCNLLTLLRETNPATRKYVRGYITIRLPGPSNNNPHEGLIEIPTALKIDELVARGKFLDERHQLNAFKSKTAKLHSASNRLIGAINLQWAVSAQRTCKSP